MTRGHRQPSMTNEAATKTTLATDDNAKQGKGKCPNTMKQGMNFLPHKRTKTTLATVTMQNKDNGYISHG